MGRGRSRGSHMDSRCEKARDAISVLSLGWYIWAIHRTGCCGAKFSLLWQWEIFSGHSDRRCSYACGLGHREGGKTQSKCSLPNLPVLLCDQCDDKSSRDPTACSCSVQNLRFPSLMWRPGWFSPILVILTPITSFFCRIVQWFGLEGTF